ncbi:MAG: hypothetical protein C0511_10980 [Hyphomicrobium sp.]|nr:hypothetical protein [Hyphomicrobium sp.]PPC81491.1 MAG: hypothetical protein CTY40_06905 [Hyphomicrobium sp.]
MAAKKNGHDDPKIASLDEARRKAQAKSKTGTTVTKATLRDRLVGGLLILMALGLIVSFVLPFLMGAR